MTLNLEVMLREMSQLEIALGHEQCPNRREFEDEYLWRLDKLKARAVPDDVWPRIEWYDHYLMGQYGIKDDFTSYLS